MSLKKKLGMAVVTTALGAAMVAGGTFAYFNATTANSNNVFTSGKIQLGQSVTLGTHDNIKPGDSGTISIVLSNLDSTLDSNLTAQFGALNDGGSYQLAKAVAVTVTKDGASVPLADSDQDGVVSYYDLAQLNLPLGQFASNDNDKTVVINWNFVETNADQNTLQGKTFTVPVSFEARQ